jgi:hypothetical protein
MYEKGKLSLYLTCVHSFAKMSIFVTHTFQKAQFKTYSLQKKKLVFTYSS